MCLIVFALDSHPRYRLILGANRDEYHDRPSEPAAFWADAPHLLAGRDRMAGGTWMGVTTNGKLAAITNYRDPQYQVTNPRSRGHLVADYLRDADLTPAEFHTTLTRDGATYDGFNLLYGTSGELQYFTNRGGSSGPVKPGTHALSNHLLDTRWPKIVTARARLEAIMRHDDPDPEEIFQALADPHPFADGLLPDTGVGLERERLLSPLFISGTDYGTRCTTVLLIDRAGAVTFMERVFDRSQQAAPTQRFDFRIQPSRS